MLGRRIWWAFQAPGSVQRTVTRSVSSLSGCSDDGNIVGDVELSVPAMELARGCVRRRGKVGSDRGLTEDHLAQTARPGRVEDEREAERDLRRPRLKKMVVRVFGGVRHRVAWWRG